MVRRIRPLALAAAATAALAPGLAAAQFDTNARSPIQFKAEASTAFDPDTCNIRLQDRVEITQARTRLRANAVTIHYTRSGGECGRTDRLEASGSVFYVTPDITVRGNNAVYNLQTEVATFTGDVIAVQGQDVTTADRMTINTQTGAVTLSGGVRGVIYPEGSAGAAP